MCARVCVRESAKPIGINELCACVCVCVCVRVCVWIACECMFVHVYMCVRVCERESARKNSTQQASMLFWCRLSSFQILPVWFFILSVLEIFQNFLLQNIRNDTFENVSNVHLLLKWNVSNVSLKTNYFWCCIENETFLKFHFGHSRMSRMFIFFRNETFRMFHWKWDISNVSFRTVENVSNLHLECVMSKHQHFRTFEFDKSLLWCFTAQ